MLLALLALPNLVWAYPFRRVKLAYVPELLFQDHAYTTSRRSENYPQLRKEHGRWWYDKVHTVRCRNLGFHGNDLLWNCTTDDLSSQYRISDAVVSCEGWDGPGDAYVVDGSCFLNFSVEKVPGTHYSIPSRPLPPARDDSFLQDMLSWLLRVILVTLFPGLFLIAGIAFYCCRRPLWPHPRPRSSRSQIPAVNVNVGLPPGSIDYDDDNRRARRNGQSSTVATTVVR